jgi:hypothetical protein
MEQGNAISPTGLVKIPFIRDLKGVINNSHFVFSSAVSKRKHYNIQNNNFASGSVWV